MDERNERKRTTGDASKRFRRHQNWSCTTAPGRAQVRIAKRRLGGSGRLPLSPKFSAYFALSASTSFKIFVIAFASCSESPRWRVSGKLNAVPSHLPHPSQI